MIYFVISSKGLESTHHNQPNLERTNTPSTTISSPALGTTQTSPLSPTQPATSSVTSPNASVSAPSSSVPSASSVSSPTSSVKPVGSSTVKPLYYAPLNGRCAWFTDPTGKDSCTPDATDLQIRAGEIEQEIKDSIGQPVQVQADLHFQLAKVLARRIDLIYPSSNGPTARASIEAMVLSPAYKNLSPERKLAYWKVVDTGLATGKIGRSDLGNMAGALWGIGQNRDVLAGHPELRGGFMGSPSGVNSSNGLAAFGMALALGSGGNLNLGIAASAGGLTFAGVAVLIVATAYVSFEAGKGLAAQIQNVLGRSGVGSLILQSSDSNDSKPGISTQAGSSTAAGSPDPNDPCSPQSFKDFGSNRRADQAAQRAQHRDAHDFKSGYVGANGSLYNMVVDKNTKRIWLEPLQRGLPAVPTDYNKAGEYIGERKLEDGKC